MDAEDCHRTSTVPTLADVGSDQQDKGLQANVIIDRDTASRLGITVSQIDNTLYDAFGRGRSRPFTLRATSST